MGGVHLQIICVCDVYTIQHWTKHARALSKLGRSVVVQHRHRGHYVGREEGAVIVMTHNADREC